MWSDESKSISRKISWPKNTRVMFGMPMPWLEHDNETKRSTKHHESISKENKTFNFVVRKREQSLRTVFKTRQTYSNSNLCFRMSRRAGFPRCSRLQRIYLRFRFLHLLHNRNVLHAATPLRLRHEPRLGMVQIWHCLSTGKIKKFKTRNLVLVRWCAFYSSVTSACWHPVSVQHDGAKTFWPK